MNDDRFEPLVFQRPATAQVNRRRALALMAASLALASGACSRPPRERIHPWVRMPEAGVGDGPLYYATATVRDGHALGVLVGTHDGRPIKIEGNPLHPSSAGATDVFAQASVLQLWDPDRSAAVMERLGDAASPRRAPPAASSWVAFETAWRAVAARMRSRAGEGLRLLTGPVSSPTLRSQLAALLQTWPRARWHQYAPPGDASARAGAVAAFGRPLQSVLHLERARCVVALGSDPFSDGPGAVRQAADWAGRRRANQPGASYAVEVSPGLFGARADRRIALAPAQLDTLVTRLAAGLLGESGTGAAGEPAAAFESALLAALQAAGPESLIVPGASLSGASHALVHAMHQRLGALGRTIDLVAPLAIAPEAGSLAELVRDMRLGAVDTLLVLDANPVYDAGGELAFAEALAKVRYSVHSGLYRDETARACDWHLPLSHEYEQWSDALGHDGSATIIQPAIAPLYDSRSLHELVAFISGDAEREGHRLVQRQWRTQAGRDFDAFWRDSLQRGVVAGSAAVPVALPAARRPATPPPREVDAKTITAQFTADPSVHDGRFANNGWLQELPRPFNKLTWDNALLVGPRTAAAAGVATGDVVRVSLGERHVDAPVWILRAHAEGAVTLPLGYGRRAAGRVGNDVGFDAYPLLPAQGFTAEVRLQPLHRRHDFAATQHTMDPSGREPARSVRAGERIDRETPAPSLYPAHANPEHAWAMTIDLDACIGCNACTIACQAENNIPVVGRQEVARGREMHWIRVDRYDTADAGGSIFQPVPCMHCENAPCELVCPVGATMHDAEGLNVQVYNRCIGTRFCSNNCPYKVRRFNFLQYTDGRTESLKAQRNPNVTVRQRGVMEKCTYCVQRIARARQHSQATGVPLRDGDVVTACQSVCPTGAIHFGDLNDPASEVAHLRQSPRQYALLGELNTRPRTTYLARVKPEENA